MKLRKNRKVERAGVNAARSFFESQGCVFQEIDLGNDYGKDAYLDLGKDDQVTGICVGLQIKSGASFKRAGGFVVPVEGHEQVWRESTVPVFGIVHDPAAERLYWCNISDFLAQHPYDCPSSIFVPEQNLLDEITIESYFRTSAINASTNTTIGQSLLRLCSNNPDHQIAAIYQCLSVGRKDSRPLILLRYSLRLLKDEVLRVALRVLSCATPHPDIFLTERNIIKQKECRAVVDHFSWNRDEIIWLLENIRWDEWQRGDSGEDLYMLLNADPTVHVTMQQVLYDSLRVLSPPSKDIAWTALYLILYWAQEDAPSIYQQILEELPDVRKLDLAAELELMLGEFQSVGLFE